VNGVYLARFAELQYWQDDPAKVGWIYVEYNGEVQVARSLTSLGTLQVPSTEWVEKYRDKVWAMVEVFEGKGAPLIFTGIAVLKDFEAGDDEFDEFVADYPYVRLNMFTENWKVISSDLADANHYTLRHVDGTELTVDRTTGEELIELFDGIHNHQILLDKDQIVIVDGINGHVITLDANGIRIVDAKNNNFIQMEASKLDLVHKGGAAKVILKDGKIELDAGSRSGGVLTTKTFDPFTGQPHIDGSVSVKATK
jgi:hypothetical protein